MGLAMKTMNSYLLNLYYGYYFPQWVKNVYYFLLPFYRELQMCLAGQRSEARGPGFKKRCKPKTPACMLSLIVHREVKRDPFKKGLSPLN